MSTISIRAGLAVVFCKLENAAALVIANYQATDGVARTFFCGVEYKVNPRLPISVSLLILDTVGL